MTLGIGLGWRPQLALHAAQYERLGFVEVLFESLRWDAPLPASLLKLKERGVKVVLHGVGLSLGSAEGFDVRRADALARAAEAIGAVCVSEHVCIVRAGGIEAGHLLPVERTQPQLETLIDNARRTREWLGVPLALENIATLVQWPGATLSDGEFLRELLEQSGCGLLLDLANVEANAKNFGLDPLAARQHEFVSALVAGAAAPSEFSAADFAAASAQLEKKVTSSKATSTGRARR